jgi:hypothetical protein
MKSEFCVLLFCAVLLLCASGGSPQTPTSRPARQALQKEYDLFTTKPGYQPGIFTPTLEMVEGGVVLSGSMVRKRDALQIRIEVGIGDTLQKAIEMRDTFFKTCQAYPDRGWRSGRKVAQEMWESTHYREPSDSWYIVARDGRAFVVIRLHYPLAGHSGGRPVFRKFSASDLRMAENMAIGILQRLTQMGYTRRSAKKPAD